MTNLSIVLLFSGAIVVTYMYRLPIILKRSRMSYLGCKVLATAQAGAVGIVVLLAWKVLSM